MPDFSIKDMFVLCNDMRDILFFFFYFNVYVRLVISIEVLMKLGKTEFDDLFWEIILNIYLIHIK